MMTGKTTVSAPSLPQPLTLQIGNTSYSIGDLLIESLLPQVRSKSNERSHAITPNSNSALYPPMDDETIVPRENYEEVIPLEEHHAIQVAQLECQNLEMGNSVIVIPDEDVNENVVEILGPNAELVYRIRNIFQYLVLFVKNLNKFFQFEIGILDSTKKYRTFHVTNSRSLARVDDKTCQIPLIFGESNEKSTGWRYLCMDLQLLTRQAFGTTHAITVRVVIRGNCRLLRIFFQDELYAHHELPAYLAFLSC